MAKRKKIRGSGGKTRPAAGENNAAEKSKGFVGGEGPPVASDGGPEDADLSALLDGELSPERESELRRRLADEPSLAARWAELGEVSGHLRILANPETRSEAESQREDARIEAMQAALRRRLAAKDEPVKDESVRDKPVYDEQVNGAQAKDAPGAQVIPLRPSRGWLLPVAAAAAAAGLVLYLGLGSSGLEDSRTRNAGSAEEVAAVGRDLSGGVASDVAVTPGIPVLSPSSLSPSSGVAMPENGLERAGAIAQASPRGDNPRVGADMDSVEIAEIDELATLNLAALGDEELAIALDFDVLADFDVIENLELLELLDELDIMEQI
jgi:anti-sigma factor RsiW